MMMRNLGLILYHWLSSMPVEQNRHNKSLGSIVLKLFIVLICCFSPVVDCASTQNLIKTVAGNGDSVTAASGSLATLTSLNFPRDVNQDSSGYMYFSEQGSNCIRRFSPVNNIILNFAGQCGSAGSTGDGGAASSALLNIPVSIAIDSVGVLYLCDYNNNRVRKVVSGTISPFAFSGTASSTGDGGAATSASMIGPHGIWVSSLGKVYIASPPNSLIRLVSAGTITTYAGTGSGSFGGDGGPATSGIINSPERVSGDSIGNIYIPDLGK